MNQTIERDIEVKTFGNYRFSHVNWGTIFAGWILAASIAMLFYLLGSAIGVTAVNLDTVEASAKGITLGSASWLIFSWLFSLFAGSFLASCLARETDKGAGAVQGMTVWALSTVMTVVLGLAGIYGTLQQAKSVLGGGAAIAAPFIAEAGQNAAPDTGQGPSLGGLENDFKQAAANAFAQAQPGIDNTDARKAIEDLNPEVIRAITGQLIRGDTEGAKNTLASRTSLSREQVDSMIAGFSAKVEQGRYQLEETADKAGKYVSAAMWLTFLTSLLSLGAAVFGGWLGARYVLNQYLHTHRWEQHPAGEKL